MIVLYAFTVRVRLQLLSVVLKTSISGAKINNSNDITKQKAEYFNGNRIISAHRGTYPL